MEADFELGSVGFFTPYSDRSRATTVEKTLPKLVNLTLIGDQGVGKSSLLYSYRYNTFPTNQNALSKESVPYKTSVSVNWVNYFLTIWDSNESADFWKDPNPAENYSEPDCFILCFSLSRKSSYEKLESKWLSQLATGFPHVPILLAGLKADCRTDENAFETLLESGIGNIVKCSAKTGEGVEYVFLRAIQSALEADCDKKWLGCCCF